MKTFSSKQFDGSSYLLTYFERRSSKGNILRKHKSFGLWNFEKEKSEVLITFRRKVSRLVKDSWYFIVSFAGSVQICLIVIIETIMIRSNGKRQNITREVAPADRSKKLLDEKRSHDRDVLQSINHELIGSSSTLLITIDNKFYRKYNLWTNTDKSFDTYLHKNKQTIIQEAQATVIIS